MGWAQHIELHEDCFKIRESPSFARSQTLAGFGIDPRPISASKRSADENFESPYNGALVKVCGRVHFFQRRLSHQCS